MNFTVGEKVKIVGEELIFEVQGFETKLIFKGGVKEEKREYVLKHPYTKEFFLVNEEEVIPESVNCVDYLLDRYNDFKELYLLLNEKEYKEKMQKIIDTLTYIQEKKRV